MIHFYKQKCLTKFQLHFKINLVDSLCCFSIHFFCLAFHLQFCHVPNSVNPTTLYPTYSTMWYCSISSVISLSFSLLKMLSHYIFLHHKKVLWEHSLLQLLGDHKFACRRFDTVLAVMLWSLMIFSILFKYGLFTHNVFN